MEFHWKRVSLFEEVAVQILAEKCQDSPTARVLECKSKPKNKWRPLPLDTVELEKQGSRKLRLTAKETIAAAEKLYTAGLISCPRTETNIFPKELQLAPLVEAQQHDNRWGEFAGQVLANGGPRPRAGTFRAVKEPFSPGRAAAGGRPSLAPGEVLPSLFSLLPPKKRLAFRMGWQEV